MVCSGKEESGELHAAADCLGKEDKMHGRNLRARGVASVDEYIGVLGTPHNDVAARLREIVLKRYPQLREDIKWHVPVYSLGTTPIVSIEGFKAHVNLKFFRGAVLRDRWNILEGTGKGVRHVKFRSTEDVDEGKIRELIDQALEQALGTR
jgi:hypothetical protein